MIDNITTAQDLRRLANVFKALPDAADSLERIGSLENAERDVKARYEILLKERDTTISSIDVAKKEAARVIDEANAESANILGAAKLEAAKIKSDAIKRSEAARVKDSAELVVIQQQVTDASAELLRLQAETMTAATTREAEEQRLVGIRDAIAQYTKV